MKKKIKLTKYERAIENALSKEKITRPANADRLMREAKILARNTLRKDATITIRLSSADLKKVKRRAGQEGLPYQTLIASLIHKFADGRLGA